MFELVTGEIDSIGGMCVILSHTRSQLGLAYATPYDFQRVCFATKSQGAEYVDNSTSLPVAYFLSIFICVTGKI